MSSKPRIVAELGRPETPEETFARKQASSRRHRENQSFGNLVAALVVCVALVVVMVLVVVRPGVPERPPVDVAAAAAAAAPAAGAHVLAPALPESWRSNVAELREGADGVVSWYVGYITPAGDFASLTQAFDANPTWLQEAIRDAPVTGERTVDGRTWLEHDQREAENPGNLEYVLTSELGDDAIIVAGTASDAELATLLDAVHAAIDAE